MFGYTRYQQFGLSQAIPTLSLWSVTTSHTALINRYTHTHNNSLACKVQGLRNAASTIAHSHCLLSLMIQYTGRNAHTQDQTFKKGVADSSASKYRHIFKNGQQKIFSAKRPLKNGQKSQTDNPKIVRATDLKYGQSGNPDGKC